MKNIRNCFTYIFIVLLLTISITPVSASNDNKSDLEIYKETLQEINDKYNTKFHIYSESEYYQFDFDNIWDMTYNQYIDHILNTDLDTVKTDCMNIINTPSIMNVKVTNTIQRSTQSSKTVFFNNNYNKMTLTYKYTTSGSVKYFDTSYKPIATVTKVAVNNYFIMRSYSGNFKNSNKTYSVLAKGDIITYYGSSAKSFTINFNI